MTKKEINEKFGIHTESFSKEFEEELNRELSTKEISDYTTYVYSFVNYMQTSLKDQ